jgi:hypothetical protein
MRFKFYCFVCAQDNEVKLIMKLAKSTVADHVTVYKLMANKHDNGTPTKFSVTPIETIK